MCLLCCTMSACAQQVRHNSNKHYNEMVDSFALMPPIASTDIVMLGDSHTEFGGDWNRYFPDTHNIRNRGIIGDDAGGIMNRLTQVCDNCPTAIFFECGANDLSHGLSSERVASDVLSVIDSIRTACSTTLLYVQSVFPINEDFGRWKRLEGKTDMIPEINEIIMRGCKERGLTYIDLFSKFKEPHSNKMRKKICKDGLHLNSAGYEIWAETLAPYIKNITHQPKKVH